MLNNKNNYCFTHNLPLIRIPYTIKDTIQYKDLDIDTTTYLLTSENETEYYTKYSY